MNKYIFTVLLIVNSMLISAQTKIIAHRGFSGIAPENTLIAFQKAIDIKADYFELDVHKTKDGVVMVIHDSSVDRTSSNSTTGKIANLNYNDLSSIKVGYTEKFGDAYHNEKIPTLKESLELAKDKIKVCVEIKVKGVEKEVIDIINDLGVQNQVIIFSFYSSVLTKIRALDKDIPILYLKGMADKMTIKFAKEINANAVGVGSKTKVTREYIDFAHGKGIEIWKYTVDDPTKMEQLTKVGLDGLITNYPDKAIQIRSKYSN